jgi:hypothetical protein
MSSRLLEIPGVGPITASVLATELGDAQQYANARQFAASVELVPRQYSTGGKPTLLGISNLLSALWRPVPRHVQPIPEQAGDSWSAVGDAYVQLIPPYGECSGNNRTSVSA